ncbi:MAG: HAD-IA family hydrolase [Deinococcus-Thermus bacterium]|jgi:HAD superfamily hydrolase (TIGR01509 family)|nr:HAD-IA family hydrolase [Deinococcota bacterium]
MTLPEAHDSAAPLDPLSFDAVLFDMDGTLVDSEPIWFEVLRGVVSEFGGELPADAHGVLHGSDRATTTVILRERFGLRGDVQAFWSRVVERLTVDLTRAQAMPNAGAWVEAVAGAGRARAVVSNSPRAMVEASLAPHAWARHLDVRVAIDDVERGKPHPDSYLLAAGRLGVPAERCLIVEDSEAGARAAVAAGATCLFVTNGVVDASRAATITPHVVAALPAIEAGLR